MMNFLFQLASALAQLLEEPILLSSQNQRLAALVLLFCLLEYPRDDFDEKRSMMFPKSTATFANVFCKYIAKGTEKESQLISLLICGGGRDVLSQFSASQIIKNDTVLPKCPGKTETLEKLKVNILIFHLFHLIVSGVVMGGAGRAGGAAAPPIFGEYQGNSVILG